MSHSRTQSTSYTRSTEHDKGRGEREWVAPCNCRSKFSSNISMILTHPVNFPCGRKPEHPEKTHDFRQSFDWLFSHESVARIEPTISEMKGACSDDCATETPYVRFLVRDIIVIKHNVSITKRGSMDKMTYNTFRAFQSKRPQVKTSPG
jgi:hypothetical protein